MQKSFKTLKVRGGRAVFVQVLEDGWYSRWSKTAPPPSRPWARSACAPVAGRRGRSGGRCVGRSPNWQFQCLRCSGEKIISVLFLDNSVIVVCVVGACSYARRACGCAAAQRDYKYGAVSHRARERMLFIFLVYNYVLQRVHWALNAAAAPRSALVERIHLWLPGLVTLFV